MYTIAAAHPRNEPGHFLAPNMTGEDTGHSLELHHRQICCAPGHGLIVDGSVLSLRPMMAPTRSWRWPDALLGKEDHHVGAVTAKLARRHRPILRAGGALFTPRRPKRPRSVTRPSARRRFVAST